MKTVFVFLCVFIPYLPVYAQSTFQKYYGTGNETGYSVKATNGDLIMLGTTGSGNSKDILIVKTDPFGTVIWSRTYGGSGNDEAFSMDETYDGGFIISGYSESFGGIVPNEFDYAFLMKINTTGDLLWSRILNIGGVDMAASIKETSDKGFVMTGSAWWFSSGPKDLFLIKTDSLGAIEWTSIFGTANPMSDIGTSVIQTRDGGYAVAGMSDEFGAPDTALMLVITNSAGIGLYSRYYKIMNASVSDDVTYAYDLIQDTDGNLVITGGAGGLFQNLFYAYAPYLLKTDSTGSFLNCRMYSLNTGAGKGYSVQQTTNGGYIVGGTMGNYYPLLLHTDTALNKIWCYYYGTLGVNSGVGINTIQTTDGGFALTGNRNLNAPGTFLSLIKTDGAGLSGCNQFIPPFGGNSSAAQYSIINGTVFNAGTSIGMNVLASDMLYTLTETTICSSTGINESVKPLFECHPNPFTERLLVTLDLNWTKGSTVELSDPAGRILEKFEVTSDQFVLSVSNLNKGVYLLTLTDPAQYRYSRKLVKQ